MVDSVEEKDIEKSASSRSPSESSQDVDEIQRDSPNASRSPSLDKTPKENQNRTGSVVSDVEDSIAIPRGERRGWLAKFSVVAEVEDPKHYARRTKWFITAIVAVAAAAAPMGSGIVLRKISDFFVAVGYLVLT